MINKKMVLSVVVAMAALTGCSSAPKEEQEGPKNEIKAQAAAGALIGTGYDPAVMVFQRRISRLDAEIIRFMTEEVKLEQDLRVVSAPKAIAECRNWLKRWTKRREVAEDARDKEEQKLLDYVKTANSKPRAGNEPGLE